MPMRFFWPSDSRSSDKASPSSQAVTEQPAEHPILSPKRRRPSAVDTSFCPSDAPCAKRVKTEQHGGLPSPVSATADGDDAGVSRRSSAALDPESVKDVIQSQFGLEILLKHDELRLINQELAKCQIALEQLRRCHLIPYPVQCPTPSQMLDISSGKGPALQARSGQPVPKWAAPFGVVEGPYARHYAKWLIPDPAFDGLQPEPYVSTEGSRVRNVEGRTTRNSMDVGAFGKRAARGLGGQRLQSLSSGYPQPKDKQGPCVLKRSDGVTVKLVCIDCHRWDFSSTQGFINHCRIAHRRDFKSHDEAAVHCGHPLEVDETGGIVGDEGQKASANPASGLVHPLLSNEPVSEQQAYKALMSRIRSSLDLYHAGKLPNVGKIPTRTDGSHSDFVASSDTPYLSQLMQKKKHNGNLSEQVNDAKTKVDWDLFTAPLDDSDVDQPNTSETPTSPKQTVLPAARTPAVMRVPARSATSPPSAVAPRPASSKGRTPTHLGLTPLDGSVSSEFPETPIYDDDMDVDLSPNTIASNNAPSLVSDDGEYDDSDDGSASDTSDAMDAESVSDVAEINIEDDVQVVAARQISHCRPPKNNAVNLKKEEPRHVTFVSPIATNNKTKGRRKQKI
ncbi:protein AHC1 [Podospora aff. communis PSN243]|uniref:Protein AHC1 n=1 Tax=Podospora aff. communis PSN243 TaxID=3040156 RepID=A0AAV9GIB6_9PEZI|nr:protein AHC1 [Podospora aff. communis PSN243]